MSATNGKRRRVGDARCEQAAWSPDRRTIACATGPSLVSIDVSSGTSTSLAKLPGRATWLRWAPDGQTLRFSVETKADRAVLQRLWEMRGDGTGLHALLPDWRPEAQVCCGGWSPDGHYFVFQVRDGARSDLWVRREGRSALGRRVDQEPVQLTSGPMRFSAPLWSSDGKQILAIGVQVRGELVRYDLRIGEFVPYLSKLSATWVTFSPDRRRVAYTTYPENTLWSARADGTDPRQLTLPPLQVDGLTWSPDGARLAFRGTQPGGRPGLYLASADGGRSELVGGPATAIGAPSWSADGRLLSVGEVPDVFGNAMGTEVIHTYDVVTRAWGSVPGSAGLWTPHWSPDGRYLAALSIRGQRLWLLDLVSGSWRPLEAESSSTARPGRVTAGISTTTRRRSAPSCAECGSATAGWSSFRIFAPSAVRPTGGPASRTTMRRLRCETSVRWRSMPWTSPWTERGCTAGRPCLRWRTVLRVSLLPDGLAK